MVFCHFLVPVPRHAYLTTDDPIPVPVPNLNGNNKIKNENENENENKNENKNKDKEDMWQPDSGEYVEADAVQMVPLDSAAKAIRGPPISSAQLSDALRPMPLSPMPCESPRMFSFEAHVIAPATARVGVGDSILCDVRQNKNRHNPHNHQHDRQHIEVLLPEGVVPSSPVRVRYFHVNDDHDVHGHSRPGYSPGHSQTATAAEAVLDSSGPRQEEHAAAGAGAAGVGTAAAGGAGGGGGAAAAGAGAAAAAAADGGGGGAGAVVPVRARRGPAPSHLKHVYL